MYVAHSLIEIGYLRWRAGDATGACAAVEEALSIDREQGRKPQVATALALLACLRGGDAMAAEVALVEAGEGGESPQVHFLLWKATGKRGHLAEAKRQLDFLVEHAPPEDREPMLKNVWFFREIAAAAREAGI